jgi:hypothetical protein
MIVRVIGVGWVFRNAKIFRAVRVIRTRAARVIRFDLLGLFDLLGFLVDCSI